MIRVDRIIKQFETEGQVQPVLHGIDLHVKRGEFVAIMGPSGSGKSTLLQLLGGLERPSSGEIHLDDVNLSAMNERERTLFRRRNIGFVFQNYQLLPTLTVEENVAFPLYAERASKMETSTRVARLLEVVGLTAQAGMFPAKLSGGQQQRVAIARALSMKPRVVLADEPTGNLDRQRGQEVLQLLSKLHREEGLTIVVVTHDMFAAGFADRIITVQDGRIVQEVSRTEVVRDELMADLVEKLNT
ncbi:ABC transporter ATP-binding protein [Paenibacillus sp. NEAU-GSW1]|uniref:ABC transporter ATP-binding protein n=1 Tax=Paenibacillus sp. NEAU-GSW1 TaxID=2682486 RepID=UPI0012E2A2FE|nr:ABC transporter ATP-binding protein [Paenibacillus sp. NEAU-GSW1]